jgi:hypothetical protein
VTQEIPCLLRMRKFFLNVQSNFRVFTPIMQH